METITKAQAYEEVPGYDLTVNNVRIFDGLKELSGLRSVGVRGRTITAISETPLEGRETIDGEGGWLMPGLIDTHVHLFSFSTITDPETMDGYFREQIPPILELFLQHGVTSIKSTGDPTSEIIELRDRLAVGSARGPRLLATGSSVTGLDGHPVSTLFGGNVWYAARAVGQVHSIQMMRDFVHLLADRKVDAIKLSSEGACCLPGSPKYIWQNAVFPNPVELVRLPKRILRAGIEAAHERGLRVTVHTVQQVAAIEAIESGADGLEHGVAVEPITDKAVVEMIRERDISYTPTLWIYGQMHPSAIPNTRMVKDAGIRIACGSDSFFGRGKYGENSLEEIELLVTAGLTPVEALVAATSEAAIKLGRRDIGTLAEGKSADMILLASNPLEDISNIRTLGMTILNGEILVDKRQAAAARD
tara:strand:+ start:33855 stop:35111 length:1257 start_codon:yes stop_codon:yes gene_type:complete